MAQNQIRFPSSNINEIDYNRMFGAPLQAQGNLTYLEFITAVKALWENAYPSIKIKPTQSGDYAEYPVIVYGLELRRTHSSEPKPRTRISPNNDVAVFGFALVCALYAMRKQLKYSSTSYTPRDLT